MATPRIPNARGVYDGDESQGQELGSQPTDSGPADRTGPDHEVWGLQHSPSVAQSDSVCVEVHKDAEV